MSVKILLADKSITIQKVVEMLFSGRDYEVVCVSDGETAMNEAKRLVPDVVLVDVDLPRIDGYSFAARLKQTPQLAQMPVILMMSRDDVFDGAKGKQAGIVDNIAKPFESQELIGKVKKALAAAPPRPVATTTSAANVPSPSTRPGEPAKPKKSVPPDIFDIISDAPTPADLANAAAFVEEESVYEVEPVVEEIEEPLARDSAKALPVGAKAVEEIRVGLGLAGNEEFKRDAAIGEFLGKAGETDRSAFTPKTPIFSSSQSSPSAQASPTLPEAELRRMAETIMTQMANEVFAKLPPVQPPQIPDETLRAMIEEKVSSLTKEAFEKLPPPQPAPMPSASEVWNMAEETVAKMAKEAFANLPPVQPPQIPAETLRAMIEERVSSMTNEALEKLPAAPQSSLSSSDMWSAAEEAVERIAREFFKNQPVMQASQPSDEKLRSMVQDVAVKTVDEALEKKAVAHPASIPESELRKMAEDTVSRMASDVFKDLTPPVPKISEETVRRGIEEAVMTIAREVARDVIERVAWETIPRMAETMIKEEIERLKAMQ